jgi:hypothetical protein
MAHLNYNARRLLVPRWLRALGLGLLGAPLQSTAALGQTDHAAQRQLAQAYITAIRSQDAAAVQALWHPASRACDNEGARAFFNEVLARQLRDGADKGLSYDIKRIEPVSAGSFVKLLPNRYYEFPVAPTYVMEVDGRSSSRQLVKVSVIIMYLALDNGRWFVDTPCPTPEGVAALGRRQP